MAVISASGSIDFILKGGSSSPWFVLLLLSCGFVILFLGKIVQKYYFSKSISYFADHKKCLNFNNRSVWERIRTYNNCLNGQDYLYLLVSGLLGSVTLCWVFCVQSPEGWISLSLLDRDAHSSVLLNTIVPTLMLCIPGKS